MDKHDVLAAIEENRLFLALQPVVSTQTHRPVFYEALLRLRAGAAVIPASDFIVPAERQNYIDAVDRRALELAIQLMERHSAFELAMNISGLTTSDFDWVRSLDGLTADRRGLASRLIVEITETAAIEDIGRTQLFIDSLKDLGCRIAIDDYGACHTNFTSLKALAPDIVKVDRSHAGGLQKGTSSYDFVDAVIEMSRHLGFETVAEGVESEAAARVLTDLGVTYLQGYLFGAPDEPTKVLSAAV